MQIALQIIKKNILSIICGVVAIAAVVAAFWPLEGKFDDLRAKVSERDGQESAIMGIVKRQRKVPIPTPNGAPILLTTFPDNATVDTVTHVLKTVLVDQAAERVNTAQTLNQVNHAFLTPNALPKPDLSAPFNFQKNLADAYAALKVKLGGCLPPSQADIDAQLKDLRATEDKQLQGISGQGATNQEFVDEEYAKKAALVPDAMRLATAQSHKMYIMPGVLEVDPSVGDSAKPPTADQIWYAQVGYWIQQDVCDAIAQTNAGSSSILESPVKSLIRLDCPVSPALYQLPFSTQGGFGRQGQAPVTTDGKPDDAVLPYPALSPTARACNPLYDVVVFNMTVNMDAREIEVFLRNLSVNRFVTVKQMSMSRLDLDDDNSGVGAVNNFVGRAPAAVNNGPVTGFIYGSKVPMARVDLQCEALFLRSWTKNSMPDQVKVDLAITTPPAGTTPALRRPTR